VYELGWPGVPTPLVRDLISVVLECPCGFQIGLRIDAREIATGWTRGKSVILALTGVWEGQCFRTAFQDLASGHG